MAVVEDLLDQWNKISIVPYQLITFRSFDENNDPIYHTDCVMSMLSKHVLINLKAIRDEDERKKVMDSLTDRINPYPLEIIELSYKEINGMCSNVFNVRGKEDQDILIMSDRARRTYREDTRRVLEENYTIVSAKLDSLE